MSTTDRTDDGRERWTEIRAADLEKVEAASLLASLALVRVADAVLRELADYLGDSGDPAAGRACQLVDDELAVRLANDRGVV